MIGPKILMLRGILVDFAHFLCILALFWAAYGIGAFAVMRPLKASVGVDSHHWMYDIASMILGWSAICEKFLGS